MRLERLVAEEVYRPTAVGTVLVGNRPAALGYAEARGNPPRPLANAAGERWLRVDRGKPDGTAHPAPW